MKNLLRRENHASNTSRGSVTEMGGLAAWRVDATRMLRCMPYDAKKGMRLCFATWPNQMCAATRTRYRIERFIVSSQHDTGF